MSFSSQKEEFDRFFNRLDRPVEENDPTSNPTGFHLWCTMLPCSLGLYCICSSATRRAGGYKPLAKSLKNFKQNYKRLNLFWVGSESKRGGAILKFAIRKSSSITSHAMVHLLRSKIVSNSFYYRMYPPYACYTSHNSQLLTYFC